MYNKSLGNEVFEIVALHLEGEANIWWFIHLSHAKVTAYADFTQRLIKNFDKKKLEGKRPSPPLAAGALALGDRTLAPLQSGLDLLTFRAPCTILEMHKEEETCSSTDATIEE